MIMRVYSALTDPPPNNTRSGVFITGGKGCWFTFCKGGKL